jgi:hypothetical protein
MASTIADEARDIEGVKVKATKRIKQLPTLPIPKSANTPKQPQATPSNANAASITARRAANAVASTYSTQVVLTSENDVRTLCSGGVEHVCACCMG